MLNFSGAIYAKLISYDIVPETHFLTNTTIEEEQCTAPVVTQKIQNVIAARSIPVDKVMSFGSDGASIMTVKGSEHTSQEREPIYDKYSLYGSPFGIV